MRWRALAPWLLLLASPQAILAQAVVTNVGIDASQGFVLENGFVAFRASEAGSGTDLNGDADSNDFVLHIYDTQSGTLTNTGLEASGQIHVSGNYVAWTVFELAQGFTDLNGDSDVNDFVLHLADMSMGTVANLGLAGSDPVIVGDTLGVRVLESKQNMTDLNGDLDANDGVLHLIDIPSGVVTNVGVDAAAGFVMNGNRVVFAASEANENNSDLNGDNDTSDLVLHAWDGTSVTNLGQATDFLGFELEGDLVAFIVVEASAGVGSLNGDGDILDEVMYVHDFSTGTTTNLQLAVDGGADFELNGGFVAMVVPESRQGNTDLNNDGDMNDDVIHVFDGSSVSNLNFAVQGFELDSGNLAFGVRESGHFGADLNGDNDAGDLVLHLYDTATGLTQNLNTDASFGFDLDGDMLLGFGASEANQGDGNGDGDTGDFTLYVFDISAGNLIALAVDPSGGLQTFQLDENYVSFGVNELAQDSTDFNNDSDVDDVVLHYFDATTGMSSNLMLDASMGHQIQDGKIAFIVSEARQGSTDLNSDGDTLDIVLHIAELDPQGPSMSPEDMLAALVEHVKSLDLNRYVEHRMLLMLRLAGHALERDQPSHAIKFLLWFRWSVHAAGRWIDSSDARALIQEADAIVDVLQAEHSDGRGHNHSCHRRHRHHRHHR